APRSTVEPHPGPSEDLLTLRQDVVQCAPEIRRGLRHLLADLGDVFLPALHDLVAELAAERARGQTFVPALRMIRHHVGHERARPAGPARSAPARRTPRPRRWARPPSRPPRPRPARRQRDRPAPTVAAGARAAAPAAAPAVPRAGPGPGLPARAVARSDPARA